MDHERGVGPGPAALLGSPSAPPATASSPASAAPSGGLPTGLWPGRSGAIGPFASAAPPCAPFGAAQFSSSFDVQSARGGAPTAHPFTPRGRLGGPKVLPDPFGFRRNRGLSGAGGDRDPSRP